MSLVLGEEKYILYNCLYCCLLSLMHLLCGDLGFTCAGSRQSVGELKLGTGDKKGRSPSVITTVFTTALHCRYYCRWQRREVAVSDWSTRDNFSQLSQSRWQDNSFWLGQSPLWPHLLFLPVYICWYGVLFSIWSYWYVFSLQWGGRGVPDDTGLFFVVVLHIASTIYR